MGYLGKIQIVDLGINNLGSLKSALEEIQYDVSIASSGSDLKSDRPTLLPGTGHFGAATRALDDLDFRRPIFEMASSGSSLLAICLGAQLLLDSSGEGPGEGLGLLNGSSELLTTSPGESVPVLGWRKVHFSNVMGSLGSDWFYFAHSFEMKPSSPGWIQGVYKRDEHHVVAVVSRHENVVGVQFHPEKSGPAGLKFLHKVLQGFQS